MKFSLIKLAVIQYLIGPGKKKDLAADDATETAKQWVDR